MRSPLALSVLLLVACEPPVAWPSSLPLDARVLYVDDGDTIDVRIDGRVERIRYIGIDAPEVAHDGVGGAPGGEAAARLNRALVAGRNVQLELDRERRDRYGRLLAYVWVDRTMVNLEMLRRGYARTLTIPPNVRYAPRFASAETTARAAGLGLWGEGALVGIEPDRHPARRHGLSITRSLEGSHRRRIGALPRSCGGSRARPRSGSLGEERARAAGRAGSRECPSAGR